MSFGELGMPAQVHHVNPNSPAFWWTGAGGLKRHGVIKRSLLHPTEFPKKMLITTKNLLLTRRRLANYNF